MNIEKTREDILRLQISVEKRKKLLKELGYRFINDDTILLMYENKINLYEMALKEEKERFTIVEKKTPIKRKQKEL
jgi:hypothetical protein